MGRAQALDDTSTGPRKPSGGRSPAVVIDNASVTYRVYEERRPDLRQIVAKGFRRRPHRRIEAVRSVSFTAYTGEAVGVVGHNGSGKSSLLRAVAGLLPVTGGAVYARRQPALLGVRSALQPTLSGRRNIYLGGLALGLSRRQIDEQFDGIIEFSGLQDYVDVPLKAYSSGMRARLHFAIATAISPEILLIDEALAVGDAEFKRRSAERIRELRSEAGTIFFVSHSAKAVLDICDRAMWLDHGELVQAGEASEVVGAYKAAMDERSREK